MTATTTPFARFLAATAAMAMSTLLVLTAVGPVHVAPVYEAPLTQVA